MLINKLPKFIIIGMAKCGTTSLYDALNKHSQIKGSFKKELYFFNNKNYYEQGKEKYKKYFPYCNKDEICFEATPHYLRFTEVPKRIKKMIPKCKFIVLLRNPITRAKSQSYGYIRQCNRKNEKPVTEDINELISMIFNNPNKFVDYHNNNVLKYYARNILTWGCYYKYLMNWLNLFPKEQILIIKSEDFFNNTKDVVNQCFDFIGVKREEVELIHRLKGSLQNRKMLGRLEYKKFSKENIEKLKNYFIDKNKKLYDLIGRDMQWEKEV